MAVFRLHIVHFSLWHTSFGSTKILFTRVFQFVCFHKQKQWVLNYLHFDLCLFLSNNNSIYCNSFFSHVQWYFIGGKWCPHFGKFGGTGGKSACVPMWSTKFIPMTMWNWKWQWNSQYPIKKRQLNLHHKHIPTVRWNLPGLSALKRKTT